MRRVSGNAPEIGRRSVVLWAIIAFGAVALFIVGVYVVGSKLEKPHTNTVRGDLAGRFDSPQAIEYLGDSYVPRKGLQTFLLMGVDKPEDTEEEIITYRNGGQSDFLLLLIVDSESKKVHQWQIDRDTMAEITTLGVLGNIAGTRLAQICLSHGFGDGKEQSCELTVEAVQRLLCGIPIDFYISIPFSAVARLNDAAGGVTVTLEDDFTEFDENMSPGATLTLSGEQAELFVRSRMTIGDGSNAARMMRQRTFMIAFMAKFDEMLVENPDMIGTLFDALEGAMVSNMKRGRMINEANKAAKYQREALWSPAGKHTVGEAGFVEFHADEDALQQAVVELFYTKVE